MKIIDKDLLDTVSNEAKTSPRLRMNYNFHQSLEDKCHRFLNAVEPGTQVPIHRHPTEGGRGQVPDTEAQSEDGRRYGE